MAAILVFFCLLANKPLLPRVRENILLNFEFKNEATSADLQENKTTLKCRPGSVVEDEAKINREPAPHSLGHFFLIQSFLGRPSRV